MQEERELQSAYAKEVLQQIQSFGEAADDEFDVQWAASLKSFSAIPENNKNLINNKTKFDKVSAAEKNYIVEKNLNKTNQNNEIQEKNLKTNDQSLNPFLNHSTESEDQDVIVQQVVIFHKKNF